MLYSLNSIQKMIKELLQRFGLRKQPDEEIVMIGLLAVKMDRKLYDSALYMGVLQDAYWNLRYAGENGDKALSLGEILAQVRPKDVKNIVLFDSPQDIGFPGNHWRIREMEVDREVATLLLCNELGTRDYNFPPIEVPFDTPLFTGISVPRLELNGRPVSLEEAARAVIEIRGDILYPESLKYIGETIMWSSPDGKLKSDKRRLSPVK